MNKVIYIFIGAIIMTSCKKDEIKTTPLASLIVTNAIVSGATAKLGSNATTIANNAFTQFALIAGANNLYIYPLTDSLHPYFNGTLNTNESEVYSLFLAGTTAAVDTVLIKENIPYRTDSTAGIRFINLANNNGALNITLATSPTINEVGGLAYKGYTDFKSYPGLYNSAPTFQVRKADGTLLTSFALTTSTIPRFANVTMVIRPNGAGVGVIMVKNDR